MKPNKGVQDFLTSSLTLGTINIFTSESIPVNSLSVPELTFPAKIPFPSAAPAGSLDISAHKFSVKQTIDLESVPRGITKYWCYFVSVSGSTTLSSVKMIDIKSKVLCSLSTDKQGQSLFNHPWYARSSGDGEASTVIVTDNSNNTLTSVRMTKGDRGEVVARRQVRWKGSWGITTDNNGNMYVLNVL